MSQVVYYRGGRGVVQVDSTAAEHIKDSLHTAALLVCEEAQQHQHWGASWTVGRRVAYMRCHGCGQTAVITRLTNCLVVDSFLHTPCRPHNVAPDEPRRAGTRPLLRRRAQ